MVLLSVIHINDTVQMFLVQVTCGVTIFKYIHYTPT